MATDLTSEIQDEGVEFEELEIPESEPIDLLAPGTDLHQKVLNFLKDRLLISERVMSRFHARWSYNEKRVQAYIHLPKWEQELKKLNDRGEPPLITRVTIPFSYAAISTITTYLLHTFTGRKPMFQVGVYNSDITENARNMESYLQYNADVTRMIRHLYQGFMDGGLYGLLIWHSSWIEKYGLRTVRRTEAYDDLYGRPAIRTVKKKEKRLIFEGTTVRSIDPFTFFPDPRVPMNEVSSRGEFVFWRTWESIHTLMRDQNEGLLKWVDKANRTMPKNESSIASARSLMAGGESHPGAIEFARDYGRIKTDFLQVDQGTVLIVPKELGLSDSDEPEHWIFTILNKDQIVQAEKLDNDHQKHPVSVAEPYSMGYGFGHLGASDYIAPFQDAIGWLFNSHIENVRSVLNDSIIYDPSMIESQDLKKSGPGRLIRLKRAAHGMDVRQAIMQLPIVDVTAQNIQDANTFLRIGSLLLGVNENLMGVQQAGGRKTATEIRTSGESAVSRLAGLARVISSQGIVELTEQMVLNAQQYLSDDFQFMVLGSDARRAPVTVGIDGLVGDFFYPIHDGTLPIDRVAMVDVWKEVLISVLRDPELRQHYDTAKIFEYVAELGGAKNIEQMRRQPGEIALASDEDVAEGERKGDLVPISQPTRGLVPRPAQRIAESLL